MFDSDTFKEYFGSSQHMPKKSLEIQQLCLLHFETQTAKNISVSLLKKAQAEGNIGYLDDYLDEVNEKGENFMHLVECRFAAPFWNPYMKD